jgi:hypothetical protein
MEFIVSSLHIVVIVDLLDSRVVEEIFSQLLQLEEDLFVTGLHQQV